MERKALEELIKWKDDKYRKPLMVWGGRQTGKTYLIRDIFARRYFPDNYIYVDLRLKMRYVIFVILQLVQPR